MNCSCKNLFVFGLNQQYRTCMLLYICIFHIVLQKPLAGRSRKYQTAGLPCKQNLMFALQVLPQIAFPHAGFDHGYNAVVNGIPHPRGMWRFEGEMGGKSYCFPGAVVSYSRENNEDFQR